MKRNLLFAIVLSVFILIGLFISANNFANAAPTSATFTMNLTVSGNSNPTVNWVQTGISETPVESTTKTVYVAFNATDNNGFADLNYSSARVVLSFSGEQSRTSTSCIAYSNSSLVMALNCTVALQYYDINGAWTINASVKDFSDAYDDDTATTLSYGSLQAIRVNKDGITFGSVTLGQSTGASNDPLILNNTGNQNFTEVNITAYSLVGVSTPSQIISASAIYVNISQDNYGNQMSNNTPVKLTNGSIRRDIGGTDINRDIYFWITVPG